jgi:hypothetical protein
MLAAACGAGIVYLTSGAAAQTKLSAEPSGPLPS